MTTMWCFVDPTSVRLALIERLDATRLSLGSTYLDLLVATVGY